MSIFNPYNQILPLPNVITNFSVQKLRLALYLLPTDVLAQSFMLFFNYSTNFLRSADVARAVYSRDRVVCHSKAHLFLVQLGLQTYSNFTMLCRSEAQRKFSMCCAYLLSMETKYLLTFRVCIRNTSRKWNNYLHQRSQSAGTQPTCMKELTQLKLIDLKFNLHE